MKLSKGINPKKIDITKDYQIKYNGDALVFQSSYCDVKEVEKNYICITAEPYLLSILEKIQNDIHLYVGKEVIKSNFSELLPDKIRSYKKWINKFYHCSIKEDNAVYVSLKYCEIYNRKKEQIKISDMVVGNKIRCIFEINKLWINENGFGISIQIQQAQVF